MLIFITNRRLCKDNFINRIGQLASAEPHAIILREKEMGQAEYEVLALKIKAICDYKNVTLIINQNIDIALKLGIPNIHLSMEALRKSRTRVTGFAQIGASVHSGEEAVEAQKLGATYLIAGHIFPTECKKDAPPRGLGFLEDVCSAVTIPVFAVGGITGERVGTVLAAGAAGMCIMSEAMTCSRPSELTKKFLAK